MKDRHLLWLPILAVGVMALAPVRAEAQDVRLSWDGSGAPRVLMSVTTYRLTGVPILKELEAWVFAGTSFQDGHLIGGAGLVKPFRVADQLIGFVGLGGEVSQSARPKFSLLLGLGFRF